MSATPRTKTAPVPTLGVPTPPPLPEDLEALLMPGDFSFSSQLAAVPAFDPGGTAGLDASRGTTRGEQSHD